MKLSDITKQYKKSEASADKGIAALKKQIANLETFKSKKREGNKKLNAVRSVLEDGSLRTIEGVSYTGKEENHNKQFASLVLNALPNRAAVGVAKAFLKSTLDEDSIITIENKKRASIAKAQTQDADEENKPSSFASND